MTTEATAVITAVAAVTATTATAVVAKPPKKPPMGPLAWFSIPDESTVAAFRACVTGSGGAWEGHGWHGCGSEVGIEAYAGFASKKKMEAFAKKAAKMGCPLVDYAM